MKTNDKQQIGVVRDNSIKAYREVVTNITPRHQMIIDSLESLEREGANNITDRQIAEACGFSDMNSVRPRITELINMGLVVEGVRTTCQATNKHVRTLHSAGTMKEWKWEAQ